MDINQLFASAKSMNIGDLVGRARAAASRYLSAKRSTSVLGIDIGSSAIKVVQIKKQAGKVILETYGELAIGPYAKLAIGQATGLPAEVLGEALSDVMLEAGTTTQNSGMAIPLSSSLVMVIEMPFVSEQRLEEMVPYEARKYIPIPISEVNLDWQRIPLGESAEGPASLPPVGKAEGAEEGGTPKTTGRRKKTRILLAAIHNEVLSRYQSIIEACSLQTSFFEIEVFSSIRSLLEGEKTTTFVLDIGSSTSKLLVIERDIILSSHIINRGSQDITHAISRSQGVGMTKAEEMKRERGLSEDPADKAIRDVAALVVTNIFTDANRALVEYERKYRKPVGRVILSGGGSLLRGIVGEAQKNFRVPVSLADPFARVESPAFLEPTLKSAGPNFAVALGIALRKIQEFE